MSDPNPPDIESEATKHLYVLTKLTEVYLAASNLWEVHTDKNGTWKNYERAEFGAWAVLGEALGYAPSDD